MDEIQRLNPGLVLRSESGPRELVLEARFRRDLLTDLARRVRAGEIASAGPVTVTPAGAYQVTVTMIGAPRRNRRPAALRIGRITMFLFAVAAVLASAAWMLVALSGASLSLFCAALLGLLAVLVAAGNRGRGNTTVISNIRVGR